SPRSFVVEDVNRDGIPDVIVANQCVLSTDCSIGSVNLLLGNSDGSLSNALVRPSGGFGTFAVAVADLNGDNRPDLIIGSQCQSSSVCSSGVITVVPNFDTFFSFSSGDQGAFCLATADFDGDGRTDLAVCSGGHLNILLSNGNFSFEPAT